METTDYNHFIELSYEEYISEICKKRDQCTSWIHEASVHLKDEELVAELQLCRQEYSRISQILIYNEPSFQSVDLKQINEIFDGLNRRIKEHHRTVPATKDTIRYNQLPEVANDDFFLHCANDNFIDAHEKIRRQSKAANDDFFYVMNEKVDSVLEMRKPQISFLKEEGEAHKKAIEKILAKDEIGELRADLNLLKLAANDEIFEQQVAHKKIDIIVEDDFTDVREKTNVREKVVPILSKKPISFMEKARQKWNGFWKKVA